MNTYSAKAQSGSSILEVLVSMIILAIGVMGVASLQSVSLRSNQSAYLRTQATIYSADIVERMHANSVATNVGSYNNVTGSEQANCMSAAHAICTSTDMANNDVFEWKRDVAAGLPMGLAQVCLDSSPNDGTFALPLCDGVGNLYVAKIWWDDDRSGVADQFYFTSFMP